MKRSMIVVLLIIATPLFAQSYWQMKQEAYKLYKSGDKTHAIDFVEKFVQTHPKSNQGKNLLAVFHYWSGHTKKAEQLLREVVSHADFPEAEKLLARIAGKRYHKRSFKSFKKEDKKTDLEYLVAQVEKNPQDIENRKLLASFYFKNSAYQKAYDMAHEVLEIDPHQKKMQTIVAHLEKRYKLSYSGALDDGSAIDKEKAKDLLKKLGHERKYAAYYNLYHALKDQHVIFSKKEYIDILHATIMIGKYKEAQAMINQGKVAINKDVLKVQLLLSKKLSKRVASR